MLFYPCYSKRVVFFPLDRPYKCKCLCVAKQHLRLVLKFCPQKSFFSIFVCEKIEKWRLAQTPGEGCRDGEEFAALVGAWRGKAHVLFPRHGTPDVPTPHTQNLQSRWTGLSRGLRMQDTHREDKDTQMGSRRVLQNLFKFLLNL